ncbi:putative Polar amino acid ABC transporter, periplasmic polar amino acid-binding protein [Agrobacterium fabacearum S56]|uniref:transporter substrate-binding domain-containing protein n=1 Tax=Agrobacterium tumefaciens TaxID=358 RepID=UPI0009D0101C|nr:transporter substrate-binding domain-containing protein [Agrobacterium tumefaciens]CUX07053.1 putative Polar amino acid ABC transporter, periplasmic polar amino acid-binding protein [Agrobacterium fabacearum S56]
MNKLAKAVAITAFTPIAAFAQSASKIDVPLPKTLATPGKLTVGINCAYPPAGFVGLDGKPSGYEVSIVKKIAIFAFGSESGLETHCVNDGNRIPFLQSGKVDMVLASLAYTAKRAEQIDYSDPIWVSNLQLVVPKDSPINSYADLKGKKVVTPTGSTYQTWLEKCHPEADLLTAQTPSELSTMLTQGRVDAFAYVDVYNYNFAAKNTNYKVVGALAASAIQGVGVNKGNAEMMIWLNAVLEEFRKNDVYFKAFASEVKDDAFVAKYRPVVPGPNVKLDYSQALNADCKS